MRCEWLILADHADILGNKLYLNGGGWDVLTITGPFPAKHLCALAASFEVGWNETNQRHNVQLEVRTADGQVLAQVAAQLEVGRPPGIPAGQSQRAQIAGNMVLDLPKSGTYEVVARVEDQIVSTVHFNVVAAPHQGLQRGAA